MALELTDQRAQTELIYASLGEAVTYIGSCQGEVSIKAIIDRASEFFPTRFESQVSDGDVKCRIQKSDVIEPMRGDTLTDSDGSWFRVDAYSSINSQEWQLEVVEIQNA